MTRATRRVVITAVALAGAVIVAWAVARSRGGHAEQVSRARDQNLDGARVRVEVLNATSTQGLALRARRQLQDAGFDVVEMGSSGARQDTTTVIDRSGHPDWAAAAARVLSPARIIVRPDSTRYLDLTVMVGTLWEPPPNPLGP